MRLRRKPFQWKCPRCGGIFAEIHVSMERRRNRLSRLTSIRGDITCDGCGFGDSEANYIRRHRGWPERGYGQPPQED